MKRADADRLAESLLSHASTNIPSRETRRVWKEVAASSQHAATELQRAYEKHNVMLLGRPATVVRTLREGATRLAHGKAEGSRTFMSVGQASALIRDLTKLRQEARALAREVEAGKPKPAHDARKVVGVEQCIGCGGEVVYKRRYAENAEHLCPACKAGVRKRVSEQRKGWLKAKRAAREKEERETSARVATCPHCKGFGCARCDASLARAAASTPCPLVHEKGADCPYLHDE